MLKTPKSFLLQMRFSDKPMPKGNKLSDTSFSIHMGMEGKNKKYHKASKNI